jgi:hypothetical protein
MAGKPGRSVAVQIWLAEKADQTGSTYYRKMS